MAAAVTTDHYIQLEPQEEERGFIPLRGPHKEVINALENPRGPNEVCKETSRRVSHAQERFLLIRGKGFTDSGQLDVRIALLAFSVPGQAVLLSFTKLGYSLLCKRKSASFYLLCFYLPPY